MLKLFVHKKPVDVSITKFPGGESMVSIKDTQDFTNVSIINALITLEFKSNDDLINLMLLTDAIKRYYDKQINIALKMDYVPYARQDRVCNPGESLSVAVIANLINSQGYSKVFIKDAHSEATPALINNCVNETLVNCAFELSQEFKSENTVIVSPDAGANKKVFAFAKAYGYDKVARADKTRNIATGKITGSKVFTDDIDVSNKDFLILDDICDGGGTFIMLAQELRKLTTGKIILYVTHGIFSKGLAPLMVGEISEIYTSNLMNGNVTDCIYKHKPIEYVKVI